MEGQADDITPAVKPKDPEPDPALSILAKLPETLKGRKVAVLVAEGTDSGLVDAVKKMGKAEGAMIAVVAPKIGGAKGTGGTIEADRALAASPSVVFDAEIIAVTGDGAKKLAEEADAKDFLNDAWRHCKVIGHVPGAKPLFDAVGRSMDADEGTVSVDGGIDDFVAVAKKHRIWDREPKVTSPG